MSNRQPIRDAAENQHHSMSLSLDSLAEPLSAIAFWIAITIPALYVPLLVVGIDGPSELFLFLSLFGVHVLSLIGGRSYRSE